MTPQQPTPDIRLDILLRLQREAQRRGGPNYNPNVEARPATPACPRCGDALTVIGTCRHCALDN
jgi:hypothetical protein